MSHTRQFVLGCIGVISSAKPDSLKELYADLHGNRYGDGLREMCRGYCQGGLTWVGRYYRNPGSRFPPLIVSEARLLASNGLSAVTVWEAASVRASYFTREMGSDDATSAYRQAHVLEQPLDTPIYFAVDYDASEEHIPTLQKYFHGSGRVLRRQATEGLITRSGSTVRARLRSAGQEQACRVYMASLFAGLGGE